MHGQARVQEVHAEICRITAKAHRDLLLHLSPKKNPLLIRIELKRKQRVATVWYGPPHSLEGREGLLFLLLSSFIVYLFQCGKLIALFCGLLPPPFLLYIYVCFPAMVCEISLGVDHFPFSLVCFALLAPPLPRLFSLLDLLFPSLFPSPSFRVLGSST